MRDRVDVAGETVDGLEFVRVRELAAAVDDLVVGLPLVDGWPRDELVVVGDGWGFSPLYAVRDVV